MDHPVAILGWILQGDTEYWIAAISHDTISGHPVGVLSKYVSEAKCVGHVANWIMEYARYSCYAGKR